MGWPLTRTRMFYEPDYYDWDSPAASEALVRQLLALHEELQALALTAADGTVLDICESAVIPKGRDAS